MSAGAVESPEQLTTATVRLLAVDHLPHAHTAVHGLATMEPHVPHAGFLVKYDACIVNALENAVTPAPPARRVVDGAVVIANTAANYHVLFRVMSFHATNGVTKHWHVGIVVRDFAESNALMQTFAINAVARMHSNALLSSLKCSSTQILMSTRIL